MNITRIKKLFILSTFLSWNNNYGIDQCSPIVQFLFNTLKIQNIVKNSFFNLYGSGCIVERSIITTPIGLYYNFQQNTFNNINASFFILNSNRGISFNNKNSISAFITPESYIKNINEHIFPFLKNTRYESFNLPFFGETLDYISVYAKRIGFILNGTYQFNDNIAAYIQLPFVYKVFHPNMPSEIQGVISMEVDQIFSNDNILQEKPVRNQKNSRDIIIEHSVIDFFGVSNSVLGIMKKLCDEKFIIEGRILLPGKNFYSQILGGNIEKAFNINSNSISIKNTLIDLITNNKITDQNSQKIKNMLYTITDRTVLGSYYNSLNDEPLGFSPSIIAKIPLKKGFYIDFYGTYIYSFNQERKGIGMKNNYTYNSKNYENSENLSEKESCDLLSYFTHILEERFIPSPINGIFIHGNQFQASFEIRSSVSDMTVSLGLDAWHKTKSSFIPSQMNIIIDTLISTTQCNLFSNFEYYGYICQIPFTLQFIAQATIYSYNISKDFGGQITFAMEY